MNTSNLPQLAENAKAAGLVIERTPADASELVDRSVLGMACVELLGKLENAFAKAREQQSTDYIDEAGKTARKMLTLLETFCKQHLQGAAGDQAGEEITKALMGSHAYDEVLKTRPLGNALLRAFWKADEVDSIKDAHIKLGEKLVRATAATLYHAIVLMDFSSELGSEIDQSTVVFVTELGETW